MFTGIVTDIGTIRSVRETNRDLRFEVDTNYDVSTLAIGASVSHAGCCLTVVETYEGGLVVEVSGETIALTTLGQWVPGHKVNLERAARVGDELGGHIVSGHVDGIGEVVSILAEGGSHRVEVRVPRPLHRFIAAKGSITIDGVSLTVNAIEDDCFGVNLIPHTWDVTTLGTLGVVSRVNLEIDMLARYLARWRETA